MTEKFEALVLGYSRYGDKGAVVRCYTREHGQVSFMVHSLYGKKSGVRPSLFLPLSHVAVVAAKSPKGSLLTLKEAKPISVFNGLHQNPIKNALAIFMAEVLQKMLRQPHPDEAKFLFLQNSINQLDKENERLALFAVRWLLELSVYGGFAPDEKSYREGFSFDLIDGIFSSNPPEHCHTLSPGLAHELYQVISHSDHIPAKGNRQGLLDALLMFYKMHVDGFGDLKSPDVLRAVFG